MKRTAEDRELTLCEDWPCGKKTPNSSSRFHYDNDR